MSIKKFLIKHNIIKDDFYAQGMVYVTANGEPTHEISDRAMWLSPVEVHCYYKDSDKMLLNVLNERHPEYKGYIWLY